MALPIGDSEAVSDDQRLFAQHQAQLTIVQQRLDDPNISNFSWLDIACGHGQVIVHLKSNIGQRGRNRIVYHGFDINSEHLKTAELRAKEAGIKYSSKVGNINDFPKLYDNSEKFDFITCTNTFHELPPLLLPLVILESIHRLTPKGSLFIYDMENIEPKELGAIAWTRPELEEITSSLLESLGVKLYRPEPGQWRHKSVTAWNIHLQRELLGLSDAQFQTNKDKASITLQKTIQEILERRLVECTQKLIAFQDSGTETVQEENDRISALFEYWALNRQATGAKK